MQNSDESFNATVWRLSPKHIYAGIKMLKIAAYIAAGMFREKCSAISRIMNTLEIKVGQQYKLYVDLYNMRMNR